MRPQPPGSPAPSPAEEPVVLRPVGQAWRPSEYLTLLLVVVLMAIVPVVQRQRDLRAQRQAAWENPVPNAKPAFLQDDQNDGGGVVLPAVTDGKIRVDVKGAVNWPTVVTLDQGARVEDAIAAANGALPEADLERLNRAQVLTDGQQLVVPFRDGDQGSDEDIDVVWPAEKRSQPLLSVNRATQEELEQIPDIGPVLAQRIVDYRNTYGPFTSLDQLDQVDGIGPAKLNTIRQYVTLD